MNRAITTPFLFCAILFFAPLTVSAITIPTVPVGNPGNAGELTGVGAGGFGVTGTVGAVAYDYRIGTTEVTNAQYAEFLNAVAATDTYDLYNTFMAAVPAFGGITRDGSPGSYTYATISGRGDKPVNFVSWYDALRFANWLHNGQPTGVQDATTTEDGTYTFSGSSTGSLGVRNPGATWFVASEDEWYKAAYYDSTSTSYFDYPTASNTAPTAEGPPGGSNSANYGGATSDLTDVGAYVSSDSPYGTFDQGGNVFEWNETLFFDGAGLRGGTFGSLSNSLHASFRGSLDPQLEDPDLGFRVASVPEPTTAVLLIVACGIVLWWRKRLK